MKIIQNRNSFHMERSFTCLYGGFLPLKRWSPVNIFETAKTLWESWNKPKKLHPLFNIYHRNKVVEWVTCSLQHFKLTSSSGCQTHWWSFKIIVQITHYITVLLPGPVLAPLKCSYRNCSKPCVFFCFNARSGGQNWHRLVVNSVLMISKEQFFLYFINWNIWSKLCGSLNRHEQICRTMNTAFTNCSTLWALSSLKMQNHVYCHRGRGRSLTLFHLVPTIMCIALGLWKQQWDIVNRGQRLHCMKQYLSIRPIEGCDKNYNVDS